MAPAGHAFGTAPVFLASISTILGAVLFLRFGYAVAHVGLLGALGIVLLGHMVTIPTALAIAEIATNRRVEGGGEYFIISRSFGKTIGAAIGISLYISQAISVAFYMIAFAEAFRPLAGAFEAFSGFPFDPRMVSIPGTVVLLALVLSRGADLGVRALWVVAVVLAVSLSLFFLGVASEDLRPVSIPLLDRVSGADPFMLVFAIVFPAFTGMTAGVGLSGDLANPRRSIPVGILGATCAGLIVYVGVVVKLAASASPEALAADPLIMARIAAWGPAIPLGLACATLSSALGSVLVAPRTLQALAADRIAPWNGVNRALQEGVGETNEPRNATLVTSAIALCMVSLGDVDFVARIISMFFMLTYGALCAISFLEHLAARPSYRPSFRSSWHVSLVGALTCLLMMFQMDPLFALLALVVMMLLYRGIRAGRGGRDDLAAIFQGVMTQTTRHFQLRLQERAARQRADEWRPSVIHVNSRSFERAAPLQIMNWLCHRYGFGSYLHFIKGELGPETARQSHRLQKRLVSMRQARGGAVFMDTIISPSYTSALAQSVQLPSVSGMENNSVLLEFSTHGEASELAEVQEGCRLAQAAHMNAFVLRHGDHFFGTRHRIDIWLTWNDDENGSLMILLAYILMGHPDWEEAEVRILAGLPRAEAKEERQRLRDMIVSGRLPISEKNVRAIPTDDGSEFTELVERLSPDADLTIMGFTYARLAEKGPELLGRFGGLRDVLFVAAGQRVEIE